MFQVSVIIPTYNPVFSIITEALNSLKGQSLDYRNWELIIIDNNSNNGIPGSLDLSWHPNAVVIKEPRQGLTFGRICGFGHSRGNIIVMVDDDNVLAPDYLQKTVTHFAANLQLGAAGGKIEGRFEGFTPAEWTRQFWEMLAIRDWGDKPLMSDPLFSKDYPAFAPVGAGMAIRKDLLTSYINAINNQKSVITDRKGKSLSSGGDNEIIINILKQNYAVAYFPDLVMQHIIPASRFTSAYLGKLSYASSKSWVQLLYSYNICPWQPISTVSLPFRIIKAYFKFKPWLRHAAFIRYSGACGTLKGLSELIS